MCEFFRRACSATMNGLMNRPDVRILSSCVFDDDVRLAFFGLA